MADIITTIIEAADGLFRVVIERREDKHETDLRIEEWARVNGASVGTEPEMEWCQLGGVGGFEWDRAVDMIVEALGQLHPGETLRFAMPTTERPRPKLELVP